MRLGTAAMCMFENGEGGLCSHAASSLSCARGHTHHWAMLRGTYCSWSC